MQDKSPYSNTNIRISSELQDFISALVEDIILKHEDFDDTKKKWVKKFAEAEGIGFEGLESNMNDFFALFKDYNPSQTDVYKRLLVKQAQSCYISQETLELLINAKIKQREQTQQSTEIISKKREQSKSVVVKADKTSSKEVKQPSPIIVEFSVNKNNSDYIETFDTNLSFFIEAQHTDSLTLLINGIPVNNNKLKTVNRYVKVKLSVPFPEGGEYEVILQAFSNDGQSNQRCKRIIIKEKKIEPPKIVDFKINDSLDDYVKIKKNSGNVYIDVVVENASFAAVYVNDVEHPIKNKMPDGSLKGRMFFSSDCSVGKKVFRIDALNNEKKVSKEKTIEIISKKRRGFITFWLWLMFFMNVGFAIGYFFFSSFAASAITQINIALLFLANSLFAIALLKWKKWGFKGFCISTLAIGLIDLYINSEESMFGSMLIIAGVLSIVLLWLILQIKKDESSCWNNLE